MQEAESRRQFERATCNLHAQQKAERAMPALHSDLRVLDHSSEACDHAGETISAGLL
jgi:hypothetical protein